MTSYAHPDLVTWMATMAALRKEIGEADNLEIAAATVTRKLYAEYSEVTALARVYAVVPYAELQDDVRGFVDHLAAAAGQSDRLTAQTPVLVLLGTTGKEPEWCDRRQSIGHRGIPLLSSEFVHGIPMVAQLLKALGVELSWLDRVEYGIEARRLLGQNGVFHVEDAATARDAEGRLVIPAQDFVAANGVKTVFGMGGSYEDGTLIVLVVFTREELRRLQVDRLTPLASLVKSETAQHVSARRIFAD